MEVTSVEAFVEAFVEVAIMEAPVEVTSVEASTTSMEASVEAFVEATSMEAFAKVSVEACVFFFLRGSFHFFHESFHRFHSFRGSFHGSFHELPRKKQVVQETDRLLLALANVSNSCWLSLPVCVASNF